MDKLKNFRDSSFKKNDTNEENKKNSEINNKLDKVLCNHCGRTISNGIRCLGICLADSEY